MAYYRRRRYGSRSRYGRSYGGYGRRRSYGRSRYSRGYGSRYRLFGRRRSYRGRRRSASTRTIRLVVQTVAASPVALGMKGQAPVRRMF